jgi:Flp pilus assembly protein TadD
VQVLKNRVIAKFGIGDRARALTDAEKAVQIEPNDPEYLQLLGLALYENGKKTEAIKYLQQAVILYPQQGNTVEVQRTAAIIQQQR